LKHLFIATYKINFFISNYLIYFAYYLTIKLTQMKKYSYEVTQDDSPDSPREWDNVTTMICFHNRYNIGDEHDYKSDNFNGWDELKEQIEADNEVLAIQPLYMYDHSGITISTSPFGCQWDSGQIGWVFITRKQLKLLCGDQDIRAERLNDIIDSEVKTYDQYLTGEVYSYEVYESETCDLGCEHKTMVESCCGFYDEADCESEAKALVEQYEKIQESLLAELKEG
jgi:hypothetical protein